jgi:hypothetical protein
MNAGRPLEMAAALDAIDMEMAAHLKDRLDRIDQSIALLAEMRKETVEIFTELFLEVI